MNSRLPVAPSSVTRTHFGVTITEGATSYQGIPKWDTFLASVRYLCLYLPTLVITLFYLIHAGVLMANAQVGTEHIST